MTIITIISQFYNRNDDKLKNKDNCSISGFELYNVEGRDIVY